MKKWRKDEINCLKTFYTLKGKKLCMEKLKRPDGSIRQRASELGLKQNQSSDFFKDWQKRAGESKIGKKRPAQGIVISNLWKTGKLKPHAGDHTPKWKNKPHPRGMLGKKHTEETLKIMAEKSKEMWKNPKCKLNSKEYRQLLSDRASRSPQAFGGILLRGGGYSRGRIGKYDIGNKKNMFFRSSWEANYALYLDFLIKNKEIKSWEFEKDTFWFEKIKRGVRSYKPDFKVITNKDLIEYHEVKGWMDAKSKTKLKRMTKYYPKIKMVLIDEDCYKDIKKKLGKALGFY